MYMHVYLAPYRQTSAQVATHFPSRWLRVFAFSSSKFCLDLSVSATRHLADWREDHEVTPVLLSVTESTDTQTGNETVQSAPPVLDGSIKTPHK